MYNKITSEMTQNSVMTYSVSLAHSLIQYTEANEDFKPQLLNLISLYNLNAGGPSLFCTAAGPGLLLTDEETAARRALWLMDAITEKRIEGYVDAGTTLATWARGREWNEPKAVVLGLQGGVFNFGIWGHPKRRCEPMDILIREDIVQNGFDAQTTRTIATLTHGIVEQGLIVADGSTGKLEPELGDWLFGDKSIALYSAPQSLITSIETHVTAVGAQHATSKDSKGTTFLALNPALYLLDIPDSDLLTVIEDDHS